MRALFFLLSWVLVLAMVVTATQLFWDKSSNSELYYFKAGTYDSYIFETTSVRWGNPDYFIVDVTEPVEVSNLTFEVYMQDIEDHNLAAHEHYRTFISQKMYLILFLLAAYLAVSNLILRFDLKEEEEKNK